MMSSPLGNAIKALTGNSRANRRPKTTGAKRQPRRRRMRRNRGSALSRMGGAPVNMRGDVKTSDSNLMHLRGTDLFASIPDMGTFDPHSVALDKIITVGDFERLGITSRTFQRIRWVSIVFELIMETASTTQGGYAMGVIRDPTDVQEDGLSGYRRFIGNQNVQISKAWENSVVRLPRRTDWLYTSDDNEPRWFSPGKLVVMVDNKIASNANNPVSASIYAHWQVSLKDPTIEDPAVTVEALTSNAALQVVGTMSATRSQQTYADNAGYALLQGVRATGEVEELVTEVFGDIPLDTTTYWKFPQPISFSVLSGSGGGGPTGALRTNQLDTLNSYFSTVWKEQCLMTFFPNGIESTVLKLNRGDLLTIDEIDVFFPADDAGDAPVFTQDSTGLKVSNLDGLNLFFAFLNDHLICGLPSDLLVTDVRSGTLLKVYFKSLYSGDLMFSNNSDGYLLANNFKTLNDAFQGLNSTIATVVATTEDEALNNLLKANITVSVVKQFPSPSAMIRFTTQTPGVNDTLDGTVVSTRAAVGINVLSGAGYCVDALGKRVTFDSANDNIPATLVLPKGTILSPWNPDLPEGFTSVNNRVGTPRFKVGPKHKVWCLERMERALAALAETE